MVSQTLFLQLCDILDNYSEFLVKVKNSNEEIYYDTAYLMKNNKPLFFGGVKICKSYISYHLMPVYVYPELLDNISPELKKRMHGKSCFNFQEINESLFEELAALTERGYAKYQKAGYLD